MYVPSGKQNWQAGKSTIDMIPDIFVLQLLYKALFIPVFPLVMFREAIRQCQE